MPSIELKEGQKAPDFTLMNQDGTPVSLSDYRGKEVLVYFYPQDDTPGCTKEACSLRDSWSDLSGLGVDVLGISPDDAKSHQKFRQKYDLPFQLLSDPDKAVMRTYGAWGEKNMYEKIVQGVIRSSFLVDAHGNLKKVWKRVKTETHGADVVKIASM